MWYIWVKLMWETPHGWGLYQPHIFPWPSLSHVDVPFPACFFLQSIFTRKSTFSFLDAIVQDGKNSTSVMRLVETETL